MYNYTITDSNGYYKFTTDPHTYGQIQNNTHYEMTVNGKDPGSEVDNVYWGGWDGDIFTDDNGYERCDPPLQPATVVLTPAATIYSNIAYNQGVDYSTGSSHSLSFHSSEGGTGYLSTSSWTVGVSWGVVGNNSAEFGRRYYAIGFYRNETNPYYSGIRSAGLSGEFDPNEWFHTAVVQEYLTPNMSQPNYGLPTDSTAHSFNLVSGASAQFYYQETSNFQWSVGYSGSVGISFLCFSISVDIDVTVTVTSGHTNEISFTIGPMPAFPEGKSEYFIVYTRGFSFTEYNHDHHDPNNKGGLELQIFDMGLFDT
jgi:hypothetical protein